MAQDSGNLSCLAALAILAVFLAPTCLFAQVGTSPNKPWGKALSPGELAEEVAQRPMSAQSIHGLSQEKRSDSQEPLVSFSKGRLTIAAEDRPLQSVLDEVSRATGVTFLVPDNRAKDRLISLRFQDLPIDEGLRLLLKDQDAFFFYGVGREGPASLRTVWVYARGAGKALEPLSPQSSGNTQDVEAMLGGFDPPVEQKENQIKTAVMQALTEEKDDEMRTRILYKTLNQGIELSEDFLSSLVRSDPSPNVRLLALDGLSRIPDMVQGIAEQALNDSDQSVRSRAQEILEELHSNQPPR